MLFWHPLLAVSPLVANCFYAVSLPTFYDQMCIFLRLWICVLLLWLLSLHQCSAQTAFFFIMCGTLHIFLDSVNLTLWTFAHPFTKLHNSVNQIQTEWVSMFSSLSRHLYADVSVFRDFSSKRCFACLINVSSLSHPSAPTSHCFVLIYLR